MKNMDAKIKNGDIVHCPSCHKDVKVYMWLCGCIRCPTENCGHCFRRCAISDPIIIEPNYNRTKKDRTL